MRIFGSEGNVYKDYCTKLHGVTSQNMVSSLLLFHKEEPYFWYLNNRKLLKPSAPCEMSLICVSRLLNGKVFMLPFLITAGTVVGVMLR